MTHKLDKLLLELKNDEISNISAIGFIENNLITKVVELNNSYLIKGISDVEWVYVVCNNESVLRTLLEKSGSNTYFASVEDWMIPIITENEKAEWILTTMRYYLTEDVEVPENKMDVIPLKKEHIEFIISQSNYKQFLTPAYVEERITKSISAAIITNDKLVAWGLTHDDAALGSLHVLDEYRKRGYGKEILISLIKQNRKLGKISFAQIEEKNISAAKLSESLGFIKDRRVNWIKLKVNI
jgi:8-oxo-dGTP diphosphatase